MTANKLELSRLVRGTVIYGLGIVLNRTLSFLLLPLFTHYLTPQDYGVSAIIGVVLVTFGVFFTLGTGNSMGICYFETQDSTERSSVIWTTAALLIGVSSVFVLLGVLFASHLSLILFHDPTYDYILRLALVTLGLQTITEPFLAYLRLEERARTFVLLSFTDAVLTVALSVLLIAGFAHGLRGMFEANLLVKSVMLPAMLLVVGRRLPLGVKPNLIRPLVRIGFPSVFGLFAFLVIDYADRVMLQRMVGIEEVGLYAVGYNFGMMMLVAVNAFGMAWPPYFVSFLQRKEEATEIFGQILKYYLVAYGMLVLVFFAAAEPLVKLMTAPDYHAAYSVVGVVALAYMLKGCYLILLPGVYFVKKLHWQAIVEWLAAAANILLNLALIPLFLKEGAAWATCLAYLTLPISTYLVSRRYLAVKYDWKRLAAVVSAIIGTTLLIVRSGVGTDLMTGTAYSLSLVLVCVFILWFAAFRENEREEIMELIRDIIQRRSWV